MPFACNDLEDSAGRRKPEKLPENEGYRTTETTKTWNRVTWSGNSWKSRDDFRER